MSQIKENKNHPKYETLFTFTLLSCIYGLASFFTNKPIFHKMINMKFVNVLLFLVRKQHNCMHTPPSKLTDKDNHQSDTNLLNAVILHWLPSAAPC